MAELDLTQPEPAAPKSDVAVIVSATPAAMFSDKGLPDRLFAHIRKEIEEFKPDLSTETGRKAVASLAFKVTKTKTAVDAAGAELIEEATKQVKAVNAERKTFRDTLDQLRDLARKPLTDWEEAEAKRVETAKAIMDDLRGAAVVSINETAAQVRERYMRIKAIVLDAAVMGQEYSIIAPHTQLTTLKALEEAYARLVKAEADAAELKRLQDAEAARAEAEQIRLSNEAAAAETKRRQDEADAAEAAAAAEAEAKRLADIAAAEAAAREDERRIAAEEAQRKIDEANAETARLQKADADRVAEEKRLADEEAERNADVAHRAAVLDKAVKGMVEATGYGGQTCQKIVAAIAKGLVPGVKMEF